MVVFLKTQATNQWDHLMFHLPHLPTVLCREAVRDVTKLTQSLSPHSKPQWHKTSLLHFWVQNCLLFTIFILVGVSCFNWIFVKFLPASTLLSLRAAPRILRPTSGFEGKKMLGLPVLLIGGNVFFFLQGRFYGFAHKHIAASLAGKEEKVKMENGHSQEKKWLA